MRPRYKGPERRTAGVRARGRRATDFTLRDPGAASALRHAPSIVAKLALPLAVVALVPSLIGIVILSHQSSRLSRDEGRLAEVVRENTASIRAINEFRHERAEETTAADMRICARVETLKTALRRIIDAERRLSVSLDAPAEVVAQLRADLAQLPAQDCRHLPTAKHG